LALLGRPSVLTEGAALVVCVVLAWLLAWSARRALTGEGQMPVLFGRRLVDGVLFPVLLLLLVYAAYGALKFSSLATKVGVNPKDGPVSAPSLAPYGAVKFVSLSTKVGQIKGSKVPAGS
jgi:hypothetical protein